jgi:hypothetical protein
MREAIRVIRGHQRTVARLDELELCVGILQRDATRRAQLLHLMRGAIKGDEGRNLVGNRSSSVAAATPCARRPCIASEALVGLPLPHLMRRAIKGSSKAHPSASFAYKATQPVAIRGNHDKISGNQWQSVAISGNQRQSEAIRGNQRQSEVIRGHPSLFRLQSALGAATAPATAPSSPQGANASSASASASASATASSCCGETLDREST